ncbi:MHYT domain-containing protein [Roseixanthobacter glucoisosaccharinicivorans]|uniref:MHYT domain-containing protein n=1 Tax=Roseixanthobacter glucoisosaccharinicivorans TaxID=3119923 RepID=UPI0037298C96
MLAHNPWLVALSLLIAAQGSYVSLLLADQVDRSVGVRRRLALAAAAMTLAVSIWSMHFVGMLAAKFPVGVDFLVLPTLVSFLICVLMVGAGVLIVHTPHPRPLRIAGGALAMGAGVMAMHYIGMSAIDMPGHMHHEPRYVLAAGVVAVAASALALWQIERPFVSASRMASAVLLGLAISGMHYTAMAGMSVMADHGAPMSSTVTPSLSHDLMAMIVAVVSFLISGGFLLSLMPERAPVAEAGAALATAHPATGRAAEPHPQGQGGLHPRDSAPHAPPPLPQRPLTATPAAGDAADLNAFLEEAPPAAPPSAANGASPRFAREIEVEKDGQRRALPVGDIVFVRANARYTYISDGAHEFFCQHTIGEVDGLLDPSAFMRVHRSYIVALAHIEAVRRVGDAGAAEIDAVLQRSIPVARARFSTLKQRVSAAKA